MQHSGQCRLDWDSVQHRWLRLLLSQGTVLLCPKNTSQTCRHDNPMSITNDTSVACATATQHPAQSAHFRANSDTAEGAVVHCLPATGQTP